MVDAAIIAILVTTGITSIAMLIKNVKKCNSVCFSCEQEIDNSGETQSFLSKMLEKLTPRKKAVKTPKATTESSESQQQNNEDLP